MFGQISVITLVFLLKSVEGYISRNVRSSLQLNGVTQCVFDDSSKSGMAYNGYGKYCGFGGSGTPIDGIDKCCKDHDDCYGAVVSDKKCEDNILDTYGNDYRWVCRNKKIECLEHEGYDLFGIIIGATTDCERALCNCDKVWAECLVQYPYPEKKAQVEGVIKDLSTRMFE